MVGSDPTLSDLVGHPHLPLRRQEYISTVVAQELARQLNPLGGFMVPSREDENQLSSDFPDEVHLILDRRDCLDLACLAAETD